MLTYSLQKQPGKSLYAALYESIRADITAGRLSEGERLPSKRALAAHLGVSIVTVESAYAQLIAEGYAQARERSGIYVCAIGTPLHSVPSLPPQSAPAQLPPPLFDLSSGSGEDVPFPFSVWVRTMRAVVAERGKDILHPVEFRGAPELRQAIATHLYQTRGIRVTPEQLLVGAGNEYLYGLLVRLLGRQSVYAVEDPGYRKIVQVYCANDVRLCRLPLDKDGLSQEALRQSEAQIVHISPAHHYPTGIVMPIRRRNELLQWAYEKEGRYLIEDDYDSELRHTGKPVPPMFSLDSRQRVLYLSTFSQTIAPSVRIAYLCLPPELMERYCQTLSFYACTVPTFEQYTLAKFISDGAYEKHLNRLRKRLREKRSDLIDLIEKSSLHGRCRIMEAGAGTHFLLQLKTQQSDAALKELARQEGLALRFLSDYEFHVHSRSALILNYACMQLEHLPQALELLARLCQDGSNKS